MLQHVIIGALHKRLLPHCLMCAGLCKAIGITEEHFSLRQDDKNKRSVEPNWTIRKRESFTIHIILCEHQPTTFLLQPFSINQRNSCTKSESSAGDGRSLMSYHQSVTAELNTSISATTQQCVIVCCYVHLISFTTLSLPF